MTADQMFHFGPLAWSQLDPDRRPKPPPGPPDKTAFDYFAEYLFFRCGVWEPAEVRRLWGEELARRKAAAK